MGKRVALEQVVMAFADFDLRRAVQTFHLTEDHTTDLFAGVEPLEPSEFLRAWLDEFGPVALGVNTEKARSEFIIAPLLAETKRRATTPLTIFSGTALEVDRDLGLTGYCDYLLARSEEFYYLRGPIMAVVEAKREDMIGGLGQCAAEMVAVQMFNEREQTSVPAVHGGITSGNIWRFLKLEGSTLFIDRQEYYLRDTAKILGILVRIAQGI